jgi:hypothetical protein
MSQKDKVIADIIDMEWEMFQKVKGIGGRASCQDDYATFNVNRVSQAESWSMAALESYLRDLETAEGEGRNLLSEKYARMMASTAPIEYKQMSHLLPTLDDTVLTLVEEIIQISLEWEKALAERYPYVIQRGRPISSDLDTPNDTSFETYLRGELQTYSRETLERYRDIALEQKSEGINGSEIIHESVVKKHGYASLQQANEKHKAPSQV